MASPSECASSTHRKRPSTEADLLAGAALSERFLSGRGPEVAELLDALSEAITIRDLSDTLLFANQAAIRHMGFETLAELQGTPLKSIMADYIVEDENGRPLKMSDVPSVRLLHGKPAEPLLMHTVHRQSGESRWDLLKTAGLRDAEGRLTAAVTIIEDLTAVKAAEVHMRMLSEWGRTLSSSLDLQETLQTVAQIAVPGLADLCVVDLIDHTMVRDHVASAHRDPALRELVGRLREFEPPELDPDSTLARVIATGKSELFAEIPNDRLVRVARNEEHRELLRKLEIRSAMAVAMRVRSRTVGVMTFCTCASQRRLSPEDLTLAEQLAARAAIAVENSRLHTTLSGVAETLQQSLLPNELPEVPGWEIAALYRPAGAGQRIEVGGDFYEVFTAESASFVLIGDITGHGVTAATLTGLMRTGARFVSRLEPQPAAILHRLDQELRHRPGTAFCTALCARVGAGELVLSSAGHPPALIVDANADVRETPTPGPLLGAFDGAQWGEEEVPVGPGELVLLYTDGVTEAAGPHERFGLPRLQRLLAEHSGASPSQLLEALDAALDQFYEGEAADDVAALALRPVPHQR